MCDDVASRFNVVVGPSGALLPFTGTLLAVLQAKHRHGMSHAIVMTAHTWHGLQSQVPVADCVNVVIDDGSSSKKYCNGVCSVGSLDAALVACATFQAVDSAFIIGEDVVADAVTHFLDGVDYVYVIRDAVEGTVLKPEPSWYDDADVFALLGDIKCPGFTTVTDVYGSKSRLGTPRTLTPWVIQQLSHEHEQLQYNRTMASVVRNGAYDEAAAAFIQAGVLLRFSLRDNTVPMLTTVEPSDYGTVPCSYRAYLECQEERAIAACGKASVTITEMHTTLHFGRTTATDTQLSCTAFFTTDSIDSVAIACVALFVQKVAASIAVQAHDLTVCYATVKVPLRAEAAVLSLVSNTAVKRPKAFPTVTDFLSLPDVCVPYVPKCD
jgi:dihydrofolate reductase